MNGQGVSVKQNGQKNGCNNNKVHEINANCVLPNTVTELFSLLHASLNRVYFVEHETYMAHSLWQAASSNKTRGGPIVGVVGMGHVAGIVQKWGKTTQEQITNLNMVPTGKKSFRLLRPALGRNAALVYLGYSVFKYFKGLYNVRPNGCLKDVETLKNKKHANIE